MTGADPQHAGELFVRALRDAAPYVHLHHGKTFVIAIPGEICARADTDRLLADIALLSGLGVRLVLVHGARPQIDAELAIRGLEPRYQRDLRITDQDAMTAVKSAVGILRADIEARMSGSLGFSLTARARLDIVGGTWVTARPVGVRDGVDHQLTGEVRRVNIAGIREVLAGERIALLSPIGYSPSGESFNLRNAEVAAAVAVGLGADKLIYVLESDPGSWVSEPAPHDSGNMSLTRAGQVFERDDAWRELSSEDRNCVRFALKAVRNGVRRVHLVGTEGHSPLLRELYTRDGCGLMIAADDDYDSTRQATIDDIGGIAELIRPLEDSGALVPRTREQLELDVGLFSVIVRDGLVTACYALIEYPDEKCAEFACVAVHPEYGGRGLGAVLLRRARRQARERGLKRLFVLTTQTPHWFVDHGFRSGSVADLPARKRDAYSTQRNSLVLIDDL